MPLKVCHWHSVVSTLSDAMQFVSWTGDERSRHSITNEHRFDGRSRPSHTDSSSYGLPDKHTQRPADRQAVDLYNSSTSGSNMQCGGAITSSHTSAENSHSYNHSGHGAQTSHLGHTSHPDLKRNNVHPNSSSSAEKTKRLVKESGNGRSLGHPSSRGEGECALAFTGYLSFTVSLNLKVGGCRVWYCWHDYSCS